MPNRLIRSGYLDSDRTNALSDWADRVFFRLLLAADDAGRYDARLDIMRSRLLPLVSRRTNEYANALAEITERGLAYEYQVDGKKYTQLMRVQRCGPSRVSKFPDWRGAYEIEYVKRQTPDGVKEFVLSSLPEGMPSATHPEGITLPEGIPKGYPRVPDTSDPLSGLSTESESETEARVDARARESIPRSRLPSGNGEIANSRPSLENAIAEAMAKGYRCDAARWYHVTTAAGWVDSRGRPIRDWRACLAAWDRLEAKMPDHGNGNGSKPPKIRSREADEWNRQKAAEAQAMGRASR